MPSERRRNVSLDDLLIQRELSAMGDAQIEQLGRDERRSHPAGEQP